SLCQVGRGFRYAWCLWMTRYACFYKPISPAPQEGGFWVGGVAGGFAARHTPLLPPSSPLAGEKGVGG
ncbi:MAG TPA: hypothetical protein PLH19_15415, partial [Anaerolineae bacterium]|nr:hypothetical protein [Anaerolineae bacterium]